MLNHLTSEEIEKQLEQMDAKEINKLIDNLKTILLFAAKKELRKAFARKITNVDQRLSTLEKKFRIGYGVRKGIVSQDNIEEGSPLWPSVEKIVP